MGLLTGAVIFLVFHTPEPEPPTPATAQKTAVQTQIPLQLAPAPERQKPQVFKKLPEPIALLQAEKTPEIKPLPPLPKGLQPREKKPDVDLTFYKELPRRKLILPPTQTQPLLGKSPRLQKTPRVLPLSQRENVQKPQASKPPFSGAYWVQIAVLSDYARALEMADQLREKGATVRILPRKGIRDTFYRVRLGPFLSHHEASRALLRWKMGGRPALILKVPSS